jgi:hypothetical protein
LNTLIVNLGLRQLRGGKKHGHNRDAIDMLNASLAGKFHVPVKTEKAYLLAPARSLRRLSPVTPSKEQAAQSEQA